VVRLGLNWGLTGSGNNSEHCGRVLAGRKLVGWRALLEAAAARRTVG